jgi:hypothetical protein
VSRVGYPVRQLHAEFMGRYAAVAVGRLARQARQLSRTGAVAPRQAALATRLADASRIARAANGGEEPDIIRASCTDVLSALGAAEDQYQVGMTKVFFRKASFDAVERVRTEELRAAATTLQRTARGLLARVAYAAARAAVCVLQRAARCASARHQLRLLREQKAAVRAQACVRGYVARHAYRRLRAAVIALQAALRGGHARVAYAVLVREARAMRLQAFWRCCSARRAFLRCRGGAVAVQCAYRAHRARVTLQRLRREAREIGNMRADNVVLRQRVKELEAQLAAAAVGGSLPVAAAATAEAPAEEEGVTAPATRVDHGAAQRTGGLLAEPQLTTVIAAALLSHALPAGGLPTAEEAMAWCQSAAAVVAARLHNTAPADLVDAVASGSAPLAIAVQAPAAAVDSTTGTPVQAGAPPAPAADIVAEAGVPAPPHARTPRPDGATAATTTAAASEAKVYQLRLASDLLRSQLARSEVAHAKAVAEVAALQRELAALRAASTSSAALKLQTAAATGHSLASPLGREGRDAATAGSAKRPRASVASSGGGSTTAASTPRGASVAAPPEAADAAGVEAAYPDAPLAAAPPVSPAFTVTAQAPVAMAGQAPMPGLSQPHLPPTPALTQHQPVPTPALSHHNLPPASPPGPMGILPFSPQLQTPPKPAKPAQESERAPAVGTHQHQQQHTSAPAAQTGLFGWRWGGGGSAKVKVGERERRAAELAAQIVAESAAAADAPLPDHDYSVMTAPGYDAGATTPAPVVPATPTAAGVLAAAARRGGGQAQPPHPARAGGMAPAPGLNLSPSAPRPMLAAPAATQHGVRPSTARLAMSAAHSAAGKVPDSNAMPSATAESQAFSQVLASTKADILGLKARVDKLTQELGVMTIARDDAVAKVGSGRRTSAGRRATDQKHRDN